MSSTFADFFSQIPAAIFFIFGLFIILLIVAIIAITYLRMRPKQAAQTAGGPPQAAAPRNPQPPRQAAPASPANFAAQTSGAGGGGGNRSDDAMPDLDMLLNMPVEPTKSAKPAPEPEKQPPRQHGLVNVRLTNGGTSSAAEILTVMRGIDDGRLIVQIADWAYASDDEEIDPEFRQRFVKIMKDISQVAPRFSKGGKAAPASSAPEPDPAPAPSRPAADPVPNFSTAEVAAVSPLDASPALDLAGAIEQYLQTKLALSPEFSSRSIHVRSAMDGGVRIEVDDEFFDSVGDVTDPAIREFLAKTIEEWQSRH